MSRVMPRTAADAPPLYQQVKDYIVTRILGGDWPEGNRVPSENELTRELSVSRMTVHRALRELTTEGWLERVQGAGTFVAPPKPQSEVLDIRNIAEEIAARGHRHSAVVRFLRRERARALDARLLGLQRGDAVFHSLIVHREDGQPVQLEDRWVNPAAAPDYLSQDFTAITPQQYLHATAPLSEAEHGVMATVPTGEDSQLSARKTQARRSGGK